MSAWQRCCICLLFTLTACAVSPYQREVNATCGQYMPSSGGCFPAQGCGALVLIELPFMGLCEGIYLLQHELSPTPAKSIRDGIYTAPRGSFSVQVPDAQASANYSAEQASLHGLSYVSFMPTVPAAPRYTVAVMAYHPKSVGDEPREGSVPGALGAGVLGVSYVSFGEVRRLRDPLDTTVDGQPARLGVYADLDINGAVDAYFLVYSLRGSDAQATVSVSWAAPCPACQAGSEAEMLASAPGAERFLRSFHLTGQTPGAAP